MVVEGLKKHRINWESSQKNSAAGGKILKKKLTRKNRSQEQKNKVQALWEIWS